MEQIISDLKPVSFRDTSFFFPSLVFLPLLRQRPISEPY